MYLHVQVDGGEGQAAEEGEHHGRRQKGRLEDQLARYIHIDRIVLQRKWNIWFAQSLQILLFFSPSIFALRSITSFKSLLLLMMSRNILRRKIP